MSSLEKVIIVVACMFPLDTHFKVPSSSSSPQVHVSLTVSWFSTESNWNCAVILEFLDSTKQLYQVAGFPTALSGASVAPCAAHSPLTPVMGLKSWNTTALLAGAELSMITSGASAVRLCTA